MPHCIVEYAKPLEQSVKPRVLVNEVFQGALDSTLFNVQDIKARAIAFDDYRSGNEGAGFVHVTAKILSGRTSEQRSLLSKAILDRLENLGLSSVSISVEVVDMERETYAKVIC